MTHPFGKFYFLNEPKIIHLRLNFKVFNFADFYKHFLRITQKKFTALLKLYSSVSSYSN